jgi:hypothetical protein
MIQTDERAYAALLSRVVNEKDAASIIGLSISFLQKDRGLQRSKIPWMKIGCSVRYRVSDLTAFMEASRRTGNDNRAAA